MWNRSCICFLLLSEKKWFDSTGNVLNKWKLSNVHPTKQNLKREPSQNFLFVDILLTILNVCLYCVFFVVALHLFHVFHIFPVLNENCNKKISLWEKIRALFHVVPAITHCLLSPNNAIVFYGTAIAPWSSASNSKSKGSRFDPTDTLGRGSGPKFVTRLPVDFVSNLMTEQWITSG